MGRHTATDGTHRTVEYELQQSGEVGWPAPPNKGHGLGWPGDLSAEDEEPAHVGRGRLFGTTPAA
jgi:hypothetical protein